MEINEESKMKEEFIDKTISHLHSNKVREMINKAIRILEDKQTFNNMEA